MRRFLLSALCLVAGLECKESKPETCTDLNPRAMRASARYTSPKGIGYSTGYTTLESFFSALYKDTWLPFVDARAHLFDNGKWAANGGMGVRYLGSSRIWGMNAYYDYRNTAHRQYNQVAAGLESLGEVWDIRINGYLPVGKKQSNLRNPSFYEFAGHTMYLRGKKDFALKGANLEVGWHVEKVQSAPLYFAGGPYYLTGKGATTWGGEFRAVGEFFDRYLRLEGNVAYDHFFKWTGQGQISVNIPFGQRETMRQSDRSCSQELALYTRLEQRVDRNEIIPVGKMKPVVPAINPATGEPYFFVFVDNTSSSLGTFESPYASLATAEANSSAYDVIYVFPGDETTTNLDAGITLKDYQMLLGAGTSQSFATQYGTVTISPMASVLPSITNTVTVVTLANGNLVSGFNIFYPGGNGISGSGINAFTASQNNFYGGAVATGSGEGILMTNATGQIAIDNNMFVQAAPMTPPGYAVHINQSSAECSVSFTNDAFYCTGTHGIFIDLSSTGVVNTLLVNESTFNSVSQANYAIEIGLADSSSMSNVIVTNSNTRDWQYGMNVLLGGTGGISNINIENSSLDYSDDGAGLFVSLTASGSINNLVLENSSFSHGQNVAYGLALNFTSTGGIGTISIDGCDLTHNTRGIDLTSSSTSSISNWTIKNSSISDNLYGFYVTAGAGSSIGTLQISDSLLNRNGNYAFYTNLTSTSSIGSITFDRCQVNNNESYGLYPNFADTSSLGTFTVRNCVFDGSVGGVYPLSSSTVQIDAITVQNCTLTSCSYPILIEALSETVEVIGCTIAGTIGGGTTAGIIVDTHPVTELNLLNNVLINNNAAGIHIGAFSAINVAHGTIANNTFIANVDNGLVIDTLTGTNFFSVTDNTFTPTSTVAAGYGASFATGAGNTLCLEFVRNKTNPTSVGGFAPYLLNGTAGTFNITANTTQANNIGTISEMNIAGSCTP